MLKLFVVVVVALVAVVSAKPYLVANNINAELNGEWEKFKTAHAKVYKPQDELMRRLIWEENLRFIQTHNLAADRKEKSFFVGMNEYSDMTPSEFVAKFNGYRGTAANRTKGSSYLGSSTPTAVPETVDWRPKGYVTPVKNQQQCGSCWAFSTTGSLEGQMFKKTGKLVSLSEQNLVDCSAKYGNNGCEGGLMDNAFRYIKANGGIDTEACYPYKAIDARCHYKSSCKSGEDTGFTDIPEGDEKSLQHAAATVGPISVAIDASHPSFQAYRTGVYEEPECSSTQLDHGVLVVGYGTHEGKDYWLVKNSWGPTWGMNGYIMMSRNKNNQCGIATQASYPLV